MEEIKKELAGLPHFEKEEASMRPCPFCGSDLVKVIFDEQYRGHCYDCKSIGPRCPSTEEAEKEWNSRVDSETAWRRRWAKNRGQGDYRD